jgi:hypothetical protein
LVNLKSDEVILSSLEEIIKEENEIVDEIEDEAEVDNR